MSDRWWLPVLLPTVLAGAGLGLGAASASFGAAAALVAAGAAGVTVWSAERRPLLLLVGLPGWGFLAGAGLTALTLRGDADRADSILGTGLLAVLLAIASGVMAGSLVLSGRRP